jgi:hypothetical protein
MKRSFPAKGKLPAIAPQARSRKKSVTKVFRCEGVYNRAEKPSMTFCGEEEHAMRVSGCGSRKSAFANYKA